MCEQSGKAHIYRVDIYLRKERSKMCFLRHIWLIVAKTHFVPVFENQSTHISGDRFFVRWLFLGGDHFIFLACLSERGSACWKTLKRELTQNVKAAITHNKNLFGSDSRSITLSKLFLASLSEKKKAFLKKEIRQRFFRGPFNLMGDSELNHLPF